MSQVDEGLIHAWLDGQLSPDEAARVERLVATDAAWGASAAEARGLTAGASRILGALDDVPSVRTTTANLNARRWWRAPWTRAAAGVVLVAGFAGLLSQILPTGEDVTARRPTIAPESSIAPSMKPVIAAAPATAPRSALAPPPPAPASKVLRDEPMGSAEKRADTAQGSSVAGAAMAVARADTARTIVARADTARTTVARADTGRATGSVANETPPTRPMLMAEQRGLAGGGRGGRAGRGVGAGLADAVAKAAFAARQLDPLLSGCWVPIDSATQPGDRLRDREVLVLRFILPTATDVQADAARPPAVARAPLTPTRQAPPSARVQNSTPRALSDSTYVTEWFQADARVQLTFTLRGDTLRGTTARVVGDMVFPASPLTAVRAACPR